MITPKQAADVVNYLSDAGAMTIGSDSQGIVWADYINDPTVGIPNVPPQDLLPAARHCLKAWANEGRSWRVDLPRYVQALKRIRSDRATAYRQRYGPMEPSDPRVTDDGPRYLAWKRAAGEAVASGEADPERVHALAYQAVGLAPPPQEISSSQDTENRQIGMEV